MTQVMTLVADDPLPTRYTLLSRLQDWDDEKSWKEFFDTYWRLIYSVALKSGLTETEAQDVVQETIICVAKDIHKFQRDRKFGSFKGWLRNLTRWRIADELRKRGRREADPENLAYAQPVRLEDIPAPEDTGMEAVWEEEWQTNLLHAALERVRRRVKEEHYQMFDLYVLKRWPVTRVARSLGVNVGQVYLAKHRVSALVKKEMRGLEERW